MLSRLANSVILTWVCPPRRSCVCDGALATLALEPFSIWPVMFISFTVLVWLIDGAAAGALAWRDRGRRNRLVVRVRLFCRRILLDRFRVSGRRQDIRLAAAVCRDRASCRHGDLRGASAGACAADMDAGRWRFLTLAAALTIAEWLRGHVVTGFPGMRSGMV